MQTCPPSCVIKDSETQVVNGVRNWGAGFMPATYQGVEFEGGTHADLAICATPEGRAARHASKGKLAFLGKLNRGFDARAARTTPSSMPASVRL